MNIVISIVTHEHDGVLPGSAILILAVIDGLVDHDLRLGYCGYRESAHANVLQLTSCVGACTFGQNAHPAVTCIAGCLAKRVLALIDEKVIVWIKPLAVGCEHAVVPNAVAKEQQILRHVGLCRSSVLQHSEIATIGIGIGCATRELIVQLVGGNYIHPHTVMTLMELLKALCLLQQCA